MTTFIFPKTFFRGPSLQHFYFFTNQTENDVAHIYIRRLR